MPENTDSFLIKQLRSTLSKMEGSLATIQDAIVWTNKSGQIQWCNAVFDHLANKSHIECLNKNFINILPLEKNNLVVDWSNHPLHPDNIIKNKHNVEMDYVYKRESFYLILHFNTTIFQFHNEVVYVTVINDITTKKENEEKINNLNKQLIVAARQAGMADIATDVVHNIGNALNGINIGVSILKETVDQSVALKFCDNIAKLFEKHGDDFAAFIGNDPSGKQFPDYLKVLVGALFNENGRLSQAISAIQKKIENMVNIVYSQEEFASSSGFHEAVNILEVIEQALSISIKAEDYEKIYITREVNVTKKVVTDKTKLLKIIVNLIKNSVDALFCINTENKKITLVAKEKDDRHFVIQVIDNGIGISANNIAKIFSHGYTTKENRYGFGLHASANFASEIGGRLSAESAGIEKGAIFTLILPYTHIKYPDF